MYLLHRIGPRLSSNWNTLEEILASEGPISFDGVYTEVYEHYKALKGKDITFFVSGKYVGGDNSFDLHSGEMPGRFCTWDQVDEMARHLDARIGYHGWEHKKCVGLTSEQVIQEIRPPINTSIFAWPHGVCDETALKCANFYYHKAYCAGPYGDGSKFQHRRPYLNWG